MNTRYPKLTKKTLTKLFDPSYRQAIMSIKDADDKLDEYARYVIRSVIQARSEKHMSSKEHSYGFSPIGVLCALKDGHIEKKFFDFATVNSMLHAEHVADAIETVKCILHIWKASDKEINGFDKDIIDKELKTIESKWFKDGKLINNIKEAQDNSEVKTK